MKKHDYASLLATHYLGNRDYLSSASTSTISQLPTPIPSVGSRVSVIAAFLEAVYDSDLAFYLRSFNFTSPSGQGKIPRDGIATLWNHSKEACAHALERHSALHLMISETE
jgi:hypothetical protein